MIALVDTGLANLASVEAALGRLQVRVQRTADPAVVAAASHVVLPGVGHFEAGMARLRSTGLAPVLSRRVRDARPTLAICLGMQLLADGSEEAPGVSGLGVLPGTARRFSAAASVPQLGWNRVDAPEGRLLTSGAAYFAHSYRLRTAPPGWRVAWSTHDGPFVAAVERGPVLACQLHPELSGAWGAALLERWLRDEPAVAAAAPASVGPRVIPCLDIRDGRVVKGVRFQGLRDAGDPVERAHRYASDGADELVVLDVSATTEGRLAAVRTVAAVRRVLDIPLTVGGGVGSIDAAARLLAAGADKVAVNTAAVADPSLLDALAARFGTQCVVLAIDAAATPGGWEVVVRSGTTRVGRPVLAWADEGVRRGAGELLVTSWDRDGTGEGYDLALLSALRGRVSVPVIASGGAAGPAHLAAALDAGASAVLAASIFHDGAHSVRDVKLQLARLGVEVRL